MNLRKKLRWQVAGIALLGVVAGVVVFPRALFFWPAAEQRLAALKVNLGLDLQGGIHLEYKVDVSQLDPSKQADALAAAEAVIERRVNAFGVGEPVVQLAKSGTEDRIIVELPGVKDIEQAKAMIKETPFLEFKQEAGGDIQKIFDQQNEAGHKQAEEILAQAKAPGADFAALAGQYSQDPGSKDKGGDLDFAKRGMFVPEFDKVIFDDSFKVGEVWPNLVESDYGWHIIKKLDERGEGDAKEVRAAHILFAKSSIDMYPDLRWQSTGLTGQNIKNAFVDYQSQGLAHPQVALELDSEGAKMFAQITKDNVGKQIAIVLDGVVVTAPTVQTEILDGHAVITGDYTLQEVKDLVGRLNEGALPVPITLVGQQSVSASLGETSLSQSLRAGIAGIAIVAAFMILYYRFLGLIAVLALLIYAAILVAIFKLSSLSPFPITMTLAGIAGFILSIGMAVDANILISERTWEEIKNGKSIPKAIEEGFRRAWPSIRDGNSSTILTCLILIWLGTGFIKGFALTLLLGVAFSMFTAIVLTRTLIRAFVGEWLGRRLWLLVPRRKRPETRNDL